METHEVIAIVDGQPTFKLPIKEMWSSLKRGGAIGILSPLEYHTAQQRKWYRGICMPGLSDWNGDTVDEWDLRLKAECNGNELLKKQIIYLGPGTFCTRLTIVGVGKKNMTQYMENIISKAIDMEWPVTPPDKKLRKGYKPELPSADDTDIGG